MITAESLLASIHNLRQRAYYPPWLVRIAVIVTRGAPFFWAWIVMLVAGSVDRNFSYTESFLIVSVVFLVAHFLNPPKVRNV